MGRTTGQVAIAAVWLSISGAAGAEPIELARSVPYDRYASVPQNVRDKCELDRILAVAVKEHNANVELVDEEPSGTVLEIVIQSVGFAPSAQIHARGKLSREGQVIGSFKAMRSTRDRNGHAATFFSGTCGKLQFVARRVGEEIAGFAADPYPNARLGELE